MDALSAQAQRLYGTTEAVAPVQHLRAGPLALELQHGRLKRLRCGAHEVWHGLAFVLRDPDWGTPEPELEPASLRLDSDGFTLEIRGRYALGVALRLHARGSADGTLWLQAEAEVLADLALNRIGLCLMHPLAACGARVEVRHVDGRTSASTFPTSIPPWPPFTLVRGLRHEWAPGRWADAELQGDSFETEDQRNNGDASFKTYSRSNLAPRPYLLAKGTLLRQSARLRLEPERMPPSVGRDRVVVPIGPDQAPLPVDAPCTVTVGAPAGAMPPLGIEIHAGDAELPALLAVLGELRPAHLHLAWRPGLAVRWEGIAAMLAAAQARLRLDVADADATALAGLGQALQRAGVAPAAVAVFPSTAQAVAAARAVFPWAAMGGGTPHFFVQLSRHDGLPAVDFASFTTAAVVHGADDDEVMQGLASIAGMVQSWRARHPALPLRVGPNGIAARASPLGAQPASDGRRRLALATVDPRSRAQFGAAWALGHVAAFAAAGVDAISLFALTGPAGLVTTDATDAKTVLRHPAFAVLQALCRPAERLACSVSQPGRVAALALRRDGRTQLLLANLGPQPQRVQADTALLLAPFAVSAHG